MPPQNSPENVAPSSVQQWLQQGEALYNNALNEFHDLEAQIENLEIRLVSKQAEVNQIAQVVGKPPVEGNRRLTAQLVTPRTMDRSRERNDSIPPSEHPSANMARALTGKFARNP